MKKIQTRGNSCQNNECKKGVHDMCTSVQQLLRLNFNNNKTVAYYAVLLMIK